MSDSDSDSSFRFLFARFPAANFASPIRNVGNACLLRSVTKNCLPRRIRIAYIAIHFDAFVVCTDRSSVGSTARCSPGKQ
ncbi:hypothetical protein F7R21_06450 [Burkholderia latens]|uniref:Uncharacterized protein n=1 Tax=Burkholderia latens TaxID=488446 RepID=A0A6H9SVH4_9BURK|nr:hypothetical protein F7R21_06450 [Burkholderia latens]